MKGVGVTAVVETPLLKGRGRRRPTTSLSLSSTEKAVTQPRPEPPGPTTGFAIKEDKDVAFYFETQIEHNIIPRQL